MKIAIVHDELAELGGGERLIATLLSLYPSADIYASTVLDAVIRFLHISKKQLHVLPIPQKFFIRHPSLFQLFAPVLWKLLNLESFDIVIASSGHLMANLIKVNRPIYIQYIHSPPKNIFGVEPATPLQKIIPYAANLRRLYMHAVRATPHVFTNSLYMQGVLRNITGTNAHCLYPPVPMAPLHVTNTKKEYFLIASRLYREKSIELAIEACNRLKERLIIIGKSTDKPYVTYLHRIAGPTIDFLGFLPEEEKEQFYSGAKAFLFCSKNEDFGIAPVEAMAHGVPVIAYYGGGAKETVIEGITGKFFRTHTAVSLIKTIQKFHPSQFSPRILYNHALRFSEERFKKEFSAYVTGLIRSQSRAARS